jgi:serine/threonine protein kinase
VTAEAQRSAQEAALRARDALAAQAKQVATLAEEARRTPALVAALGGRTEPRALGDLLASAPWWERHRALATGISYKDNLIAFAQPGLRGLSFGQLVAQVRTTGAPAAAVLPGPTRVHLVSALAIPGPPSLPPAVLVLSRTVDDALLAALAQSAGGAVQLRDGPRALGSAGADAARLADSLPAEAAPAADPGWATSSVWLGPQLALIVGVRPVALNQALNAVDLRRKLLFWGVAVLLAVPLIISSFRRARRPARARPRARTQTARIRPPAPAEPAPAAATGGDPASAAGPAPGRPGPRPRPRPRERGTTLGRYQLVDRIGEGTLAEVFTAVFQGAGGVHRSVVVKRLRAEMAENPAAVAHFTDEAKLLSKLVHPNLVPVFDCGEADDSYFIAEEYVVGRDVHRLTKRLLESGHPPLSLSGTMYVIHEILGGLAYVHGERPGLDAPAGFLHRDISPHNVMVSRLGEVKLLDFRIARAQKDLALVDAGAGAGTGTGAAKGHVDFLSPEQARGRGVDHRSDLFSVGLLLFQCAAREPLYRGDTQYDRLSRAAHGPGLQEVERLAALPAPLPALLKRALATNPENRYQSAAEFREAVAPHVRAGEDEVAGLVSDLFADELQAEIDHLSMAVPAPAVAPRADRRLG